MSKLNYYTSQSSYHTSLPIFGLVRVDDPAPSMDNSCLTFILMNSHFHVLLYHSDHKVAYACDSMDLVSDSGVQSSLSTYLGIPIIKPLPFANSVGVDHCGAAAVAIALELLRQFKQDELSSRGIVRVPDSRLSLLVSQMHKGPSVSIRGWVPINSRSKFICRFCEYSTWNKRAVLMHERSHL